MSKNEYFHVAKTWITNHKSANLHTHNFAEIFIIERGVGWHEINGKTMPLTDGSVVFIRPEDRHDFRTDHPDGFTILNIAFHQKTVEHLNASYASHAAPFFPETLLPVQRVLLPEKMTGLISLATQLSHETRSRATIVRFLLNCFYIMKDVAENNSSPDWLQRAIQQFGKPEHLNEGTPALARLARHGPEHVNRQIKKHFKMTATEIVNQKRLEYAAQRLRMDNLKIIEIAFDCGFNHLGHFYQLFQKKFGVTPRAYRHHHRHVFLP